MSFNFFKTTASAILILFITTFVSCSDEEFVVADGTEITTTVSVSVPETFKSRAVPDVYPSGSVTYLGESGYPSIGNVDLNTHNLSFTVGVYVEKTVDGATSYIRVDKQSRTGVSDDKADFNFKLVKGQKYRIVAYADFSGAAQEDLTNIPFSAQLNNELSDAFFASESFIADDHLTVVLKRPFGKLRLIARDFDTFAKGEVLKINQVKVTYAKPDNDALSTNSFNAITGIFNTADGVSREFSAAPVVYSMEYLGESVGYAAVFTMYLPANFGTEDTSNKYAPVEEGTPVPQSWMYPFDIEIAYTGSDGKPATIKRSYDIDIPVKRNWLTTVDVSDFWTDNSTVSVTIDHRFEGFINQPGNLVYVHNETDLQNAIDAICAGAASSSKVSGKIVLGSDIVLKDKVGFVIDKVVNKNAYIDIYLDLNGHRITCDGSGVRTYTDVNGKTKDIGGIFAIRNMYQTLHIIDSKPETKVGGVYYTGPDDDGHALPLIYCFNGGCVVIEEGNFVTTSSGSCVYVYEQPLSGHSYHQYFAFLATKSKMKDPENPTPEEMAVYNRYLKLITSKATINGGWFENAQPAETADDKKVTINSYNIEESDWLKYHDDPVKYYKCPAWTDWGPFPGEGCTFGYVSCHGGSYAEFNPANGDNVCGNTPEPWIDESHVVLTEVIDGKTVYTVVPIDSVEPL